MPGPNSHTRQKYSREWAIQQRAEHGHLNCLMFWSHRAAKGGRVGPSSFSQWFESPFRVDRIKYHTAEHWMMAEKARLFKDKEALGEILASKDPEKAKHAGRKVRNYDGTLWDRHRYQAVIEGNFHKFSAHKDLRAYLLKTGDTLLVEASPVDAVWGTGLAAAHVDAQNPAAWPGLNLLGFALMEVRDRLREAD
ncbi:MAG: NADAR family protein [Alphaproteobacteria bacterium]|nr:NADAR family protein [Alphaproteobacteria bacterium]